MPPPHPFLFPALSSCLELIVTNIIWFTYYIVYCLFSRTKAKELFCSLLYLLSFVKSPPHHSCAMLINSFSSFLALSSEIRFPPTHDFIYSHINESELFKRQISVSTYKKLASNSSDCGGACRAPRLVSSQHHLGLLRNANSWSSLHVSWIKNAGEGPCNV